MRDFYYTETSVCRNHKREKAKYTILFIFSIINWIFAIFSFIAMFSFPINENNILVSILIYVILIALFVASAIVLGRLKYKFCLDYDYLLVNGSIRIYCISNNVRNRKIAEFDYSDVIKVGKTDEDECFKLCESPSVRKVFATSNFNKDTVAYYIYATCDGEKKIFILDCTVEFIKSLRIYLRADIFSKGVL